MRSNGLIWVSGYERLSKDPKVAYGFWKIKRTGAWFGSLLTSKKWDGR